MASRPSAGRYKVTKAALALVGLIRSSLQEACEAGTPAAVQSGCNAVLDMASLLIAVPQGVHGEQLQVGTLCGAGALPHSVKSSCRSPPVLPGASPSQQGAAAGQQLCLHRRLSLTKHRRDVASPLTVTPGGVAQEAVHTFLERSSILPLPASRGGFQLLSIHQLQP